jgi:hypothetical protein
MMTPRKQRKSHHRQEIERIAEFHAAVVLGVGAGPEHPSQRESERHQRRGRERGRDQDEERGIERGHDPADAQEHHARCDRDTRRQQPRRALTRGGAARVGDGDRGGGCEPAGGGCQDQSATRTEIFHRGIAEEGDAGENDGDDPYIPPAD